MMACGNWILPWKEKLRCVIVYLLAALSEQTSFFTHDFWTAVIGAFVIFWGRTSCKVYLSTTKNIAIQKSTINQRTSIGFIFGIHYYGYYGSTFRILWRTPATGLPLTPYRAGVRWATMPWWCWLNGLSTHATLSVVMLLVLWLALTSLGHLESKGGDNRVFGLVFPNELLPVILLLVSPLPWKSFLPSFFWSSRLEDGSVSLSLKLSLCYYFLIFWYSTPVSIQYNSRSSHGQSITLVDTFVCVMAIPISQVCYRSGFWFCPRLFCPCESGRGKPEHQSWSH